MRYPIRGRLWAYQALALKPRAQRVEDAVDPVVRARAWSHYARQLLLYVRGFYAGA